MKKKSVLLDRLRLSPDRFYSQSQRVGGVGTWIYICGTGEYWWSPAAYTLYGLPKTSCSRQDGFMSSIIPEDRPGVEEAFRGLLRGEPYRVTYRAQVRGKQKWLEQKGRLYSGPKHPVPYVMGMVRDVTDLKTEQLRLENKRANFAAITDYLAETTDTTDLKAIVASVKSTLRRRLEVIAISVFVKRGDEVERVSPEGDPLPAFLFQDVRDFIGYRAAQSGKFQSCLIADYPNRLGRETLETAGGKRIFAVPIRHGKAVIGALSVVLKKEEKLTGEEREFYRTICGHLSNQLNSALLYEQLTRELALRTRLESDRDVIFNESVDFISIIDKDGAFLQINPAFARRLGFSPEGLVGRSVFDFIHPDDRPFARYTFDQLPKRKVIRGFYNRFLCRDEEIGYLENNLKYMDETGNTIAIARDVTNLREAEARNTDLEQSIAMEKMKSDFFSSLSHEFKTPLNIILSSLDLMRMKQEREDKVHFQETYEKFFDYAYQNCYRLLRLSSNLLDSSRIDTQFLCLEPVDRELVTLLGDIVESAQCYAQERDIALTFTCRLAGEAWARCDEGGLDRIVLNLLSNAIKHTPAGGHISVELESAGGFYKVTVTDDGSGISPDFLPHIFDKFRTERTGLSERQGGSGIGLFLVKSMVALHGGTVWAESTPGKGSRFSFTLPKGCCAAESGSAETCFGGESYRVRAKLELSDLD